MLRFVGTVRKKALYNRWYARFPALARSRDVNLKEVDPPFPNASWYVFETETIILVRGYGDDAQSFTHELAHHVGLRILTPAQQAAWATFWQAHRLEMPSRYARQNPPEGFAESLSFRVRGLKVRKVIADYLAGL